MAQLGTVTITGYAGGDPVEFGKSGGPAACSFRLGCTRGYYNADHVWQNLPTTWITVKTFRRLATNVCQSIRKGDAVIVTGHLATEEWTSQGEDRSRLVVEATSVGHDLNGGVTFLRRIQKGSTLERTATADSFSNEQSTEITGSSDNHYANSRTTIINNADTNEPGGIDEFNESYDPQF